MSTIPGSIHVLHVDDAPDLADTAATFIEREDERFAVETTTSADEGLDRLRNDEFDCIISDYDMPGKNGIEFLEAVRDEYPDLPFILYTGKGSEEIASDAISAGVTDYLQKGNGTSQYTVLANRIRNAVEQYHTQTALAEREQRLNLFFEQSPLGVIEWDDNFELRRMNDAAEEILGYEQKTLAGESWEVIVPESDREEVRDVVSDLLENAGGYHSINENVREDGEVIICEWHNRVIIDDDGEVLAVFSQFQDITDQQRLKQKREEVIERVTDAIVEVDADWRFTLVNEQAEEIADIDAEELLGRDSWEVFEDVKGTRFEEEYREVMETREPTTFVEYFSGLDSWLDIEAYPKDDGGIAFYIVEVTEQRQRQEELEQTNAVLSTLFETLPVGVLAEDGSRTVIEANERLFDLFEFPGGPEDVIGADCEEMAEQISDMFIDPDDFVDRVNELVATREPIDNEELTLHAGRTFERSYRPIQLPNGDGHLWMYRDITDRKEREARLRDLNETTQRLMTAKSRERVSELGVEAAREVLGLEANAIHLYDDEQAELVPIAATDTLADRIGDIPTFTEGDSIAWRVYEQGEPLALDDVHDDPDIHNPETDLQSELYLPLGAHGILIAASETAETFDQQDAVLGEILAGSIAGALKNVERTERLRAREQELTQQNERLDEFASIVSHDLRNPLNVAQGRLELANEECDSEHLDAVGRTHERMNVLIDDLLTLAREGEQVDDLEPVDLASLIENCWQNVATADATLTTEIDRRIQADQSRLQQLLENLMRNAVDHGGEDVTVTIGALDDGFYVEDTGPGIPEDEQDDVFEAGYSTSADGTGFGLSIGKQVAHAHGWEVRVTDGSEGGARFEITGVEFSAA